MLPHRGRSLPAIAASIILPFSAAHGEGVGRPVSHEAAARAKALALYFCATKLEKALEYEAASAAFEQLLALDPTNTSVSMRAASLSAKLGNRSRGRKIIDSSLAANPGRAEPYFNLARYLDLFQPPGGEAEFSSRALEVAAIAEEKFPLDSRVCELLVDLHLRVRDPESAASAVRRFAKREGPGAQFWLALGTQALRCFDLTGGRGDAVRAEIDELFERALRASAGRPEVADSVANYHIGARHYERARDILAPVVKAHPELALEREKLARVYRILGQPDEAINELEILIAAYPNESRTQRMMAELLAGKGDHAGAVHHRARAVQLGGAEDSDFIELAVALSDRFYPPRYAEALQWLERGLARSPVAPRLHYMKGIVSSNSGNFEQAFSSYQRAEKVAKVTLPDLLDEGFYYNFGVAAERTGEFGEARLHFKRAVELVPREAPEKAAKSLNDHGFMLLEIDEDIEVAGELIRRAVELAPDNPIYLDSLGYYYFKIGAPEKALAELKRAKQLMGADVDPEVLAHIEAVEKSLDD